ncbi:MAG: F0F1 ATP synthase subunit delta [Patescibacteria group bacterium]
MRRLSPGQIAQVLISQAPQIPPAHLAEALGKILAKTGRLSDLPLIRAALAVKLETLGLITIETAQPLAKSGEEALQQQLAASHPGRLVIFSVNRRLLAGFRLARSGHVFDASLAGSLKRLKSHLESKQGGLYA